MNFWSPHIHAAFTFIHIFAAVFWLGWMAFIFFVMRPVVSRMSSLDVQNFMVPIRRRVRKVVFWLIPIILLTGLYNMGYRGLLNWHMLLDTATGHRMMWKLGAAAVLFSIYYFAPFVMGGQLLKKALNDEQKLNPKAKRVEIIMHLVAFTAGCIAAYLGIMIGG